MRKELFSNRFTLLVYIWIEREACAQTNGFCCSRCITSIDVDSMKHVPENNKLISKAHALATERFSRGYSLKVAIWAKQVGDLRTHVCQNASVVVIVHRHCWSVTEGMAQLRISVTSVMSSLCSTYRWSLWHCMRLIEQDKRLLNWKCRKNKLRSMIGLGFLGKLMMPKWWWCLSWWQILLGLFTLQIYYLQYIL